MSAIKSENHELAKMGIEFWTTIADEEIELQYELEDAQSVGTTPERTSCYYTRGALEALLPELLECLTKQVRRAVAGRVAGRVALYAHLLSAPGKLQPSGAAVAQLPPPPQTSSSPPQEEDEDEDEWTISKAAAVCLDLVAQCCGDMALQVGDAVVCLAGRPTALSLAPGHVLTLCPPRRPGMLHLYPNKPRLGGLAPPRCRRHGLWQHPGRPSRGCRTLAD